MPPLLFTRDSNLEAYNRRKEPEKAAVPFRFRLVHV